MYHKHIGGRPAVSKEKIRFKTIGVRVNQKEWDMLNQKAQEMNMSPARFLRECALKKRLPLPPVPELNRKAYANLMRIGNNINQLARSVNFGQTQLTHHYLKLFNELQQAISQTQSQLLGLDSLQTDSELGGSEKYDSQGN